MMRFSKKSRGSHMKWNDKYNIKLLNLLMKKERKSRKKDHLRIKYSEIGNLLDVMRLLHNSDSILMQAKLNSYLQTATEASVTFLIEKSKKFLQAVVRVIGTITLSSRLIFQGDNVFLARLRKIEKAAEIPECFLDPNLLECLRDILIRGYDVDLKNCFVFPVYHPYRKNVMFYYALLNIDTEANSLAYYQGVVGECFRYCYGAIYPALRYDEEKRFHEKYKNIMSLNVESIGHLDNLQILSENIQYQTLKTLEAKRCQLYFIDGKKVVTFISEWGQGYECSQESKRFTCIQFGQGIVGTVAETGKIFNCVNTENDPLYISAPPTKFFCRNLLAFPVLVYDGVFGVIVAYDKCGAIHFDQMDVSLAKILGPLFGIQLHICLSKKKLWDALNRRAMIDKLFLRDSKTTSSGEATETLECQDLHDYPDFLTYKFIPANVEVTHVLCICLRFFEEDDLLKKHFIERSTFLRFLIRIRNRHFSLPLHNWQRSFSSLHFLKVMAKNEKLIEGEYVTDMELLAMYLAALCHQMECRGSTTIFQPTAGTTLGSLYSTPGSLLQFQGISQLLRIMTSNENNIVESMDSQMYRDFVKTLDRMFSYTDLAHHVIVRNDIGTFINKYDNKNPEQYTLLHSLILTCAVLSDYSKPYGYCEKFSSLSLEEFFTKDLSQCTGVLNLEEFIAEVEVRKASLQMHFTRTICEEAFRLLREIFPRTSDCYATVMENGSEFEKKKEEAIKALMEQF